MRQRLITNFNSIQEWKDYCFSNHSLYLKNRHFRKWIGKKEICIFNFSNLSKNGLRCIKLGIEDAIKIAKLHFKIRYGDHAKLGEIIKINHEKINSVKLLKMIIKKRKEGGEEHANVCILKNQIVSADVVIRDGEALTFVSEGVILFTFDAFKTYSSKFLRRRAKHEALHMLGLNIHHEDTKVIGYKDAMCIMKYNAPTIHICEKCKDALKSFWSGIKYATEK